MKGMGNRSWGMILLGVYLILVGLAIFGVALPPVVTGVVALAALTGAPVVPLGLGARPARRLNSWDEFRIPLPFARYAVVFGEPMPVSRDADRAQAGKEFEQALDEASGLADRLVAS